MNVEGGVAGTGTYARTGRLSSAAAASAAAACRLRRRAFAHGVRRRDVAVVGAATEEGAEGIEYTPLCAQRVRAGCLALRSACCVPPAACYARPLPASCQL